MKDIDTKMKRTNCLNKYNKLFEYKLKSKWQECPHRIDSIKITGKSFEECAINRISEKKTFAVESLNFTLHVPVYDKKKWLVVTMQSENNKKLKSTEIKKLIWLLVKSWAQIK